MSNSLHEPGIAEMREDQRNRRRLGEVGITPRGIHAEPVDGAGVKNFAAADDERDRLEQCLGDQRFEIIDLHLPVEHRFDL